MRSAAMNRAIATAREHGLLGRLLGSDREFDMEVRVGAGAYVCGEETSLLESIEGKRGEVRAKPPLPAHVGLFGRPTIINNVLTLAAVPCDPFRRRQGLCRFRHGQVARDDADPARRQYPQRRPVRDRLRDHIGRAGRGCRRRDALGASGSRRPGRRALGRLFPALDVRLAVRLRSVRRRRRPDRSRAASSCSTTASTWRRWRVSRWNSARRRAAASARPAGSARCAAWR